jgi:hypothetical protein
MPDLSRDVEFSAMSLHLLVIGGSYAACLAARAQVTDPLSVSATRGGWRARRTAGENVTADLSDLGRSVTQEHVALLQLLDNVVYAMTT